jgi:hypothetical protein
MRQVTKEEFFAVINPLDVHPRVDAISLKSECHVSHWEMKYTRKLVGVSKSTTNKPTEFYLAA